MIRSQSFRKEQNQLRGNTLEYEVKESKNSFGSMLRKVCVPALVTTAIMISASGCTSLSAPERVDAQLPQGYQATPIGYSGWFSCANGIAIKDPSGKLVGTIPGKCNTKFDVAEGIGALGVGVYVGYNVGNSIDNASTNLEKFKFPPVKVTLP
jgi:hypothetical protein